MQEVRALHRDDSSSASLEVAASSSALDGPGPSGLLPVPEGAAQPQPAALEAEQQQLGRSIEGQAAAERGSGGGG